MVSLSVMPVPLPEPTRVKPAIVTVPPPLIAIAAPPFKVTVPPTPERLRPWVMLIGPEA